MTRRIVSEQHVWPRLDYSLRYSLCDDGSSWVRDPDGWHRLPDIPQDEPAVDPIAEIEAIGGRLGISGGCIQWRLFADDGRVLDVETVDRERDFLESSDLRAAAARLLERVRGAKS